MSKDLWLVFYLVYGSAALLLVIMLLRGLIRKHPMRRIFSDMGTPLRLIILSLSVWVATLYIAKDFAGRF